MRIYQKSSHFVDTEGLLIKKYESNITTHRHSHNFIEIVYIISGNGIHEINNISYTISPGCFYIVKSGEIHNLSFSETSIYYNIFIKEEYLANTLLGDSDSITILNLIQNIKGTEHSVCFSTNKFGIIESLFNNAFLELNKSKNYNSDLIVNYLRLLFLEYRSSLNSSSVQKQPEFILPKAVDYINMHYKENLQIADIAKKYNYNPVYFGRMFQQHYGKNIKEYISDLRITTASELLITTDHNITEICEYVGYTNKLHFYKKFEGKFGCTPKEYKNQALKKDNMLAVTNEAPPLSSHKSLINYTEWAKDIFKSGNYYTITVNDNEMNGIGINKNDTVVICKSISPKNGDIVAVSCENNNIIIRQLYIHPDESGQYILHSCTKANQHHSDIYLNNIEIYGVVSHVIHMLNR